MLAEALGDNAVARFGFDALADFFNKPTRFGVEHEEVVVQIQLFTVETFIPEIRVFAIFKISSDFKRNQKTFVFVSTTKQSFSSVSIPDRRIPERNSIMPTIKFIILTIGFAETVLTLIFVDQLDTTHSCAY